MNTKRSRWLRLIAVAALFTMVAGACGSDDETSSSDTTTAVADTTADTTDDGASDRPSWCGPDEIRLGFTDGFGGNSWRLVTTEAARDEASKCSSVSQVDYADGGGDTQKAIADIQAMVATGVDALVVFPDAGDAILPALRSAYEEGVVTVPYRVDPGGTVGEDFDAFIDADHFAAGVVWGEWLLENLPDGGNVLMISGPAGNSQGVLESEGLASVLEPTGNYTMIGEQPFSVTGWDPAVTQQVLTAAIAQFPEIDAIVSDFGPSLVGALPEFEKSGRSVPKIATSDGNSLACFYEENKANNPDFDLFTVTTQNDHARLAVQWAVALATGGTPPQDEIYPAIPFEDSITGSPNSVTCRSDLSGQIYLSAEMDADAQDALIG